MKSIRLYQIPFSHFCDKVRWALDFYSLPYQTINYNGSKTKGLEKAPRTLQKLSPIIEDPNNKSLFISDSTPILIYLDQHYANNNNNKTLFSSNKSNEKDNIIEYCLKLDSQLGLYARRLAYVQLIHEKPAILSVFVDGKLDKNSCDDWKSYFLGLIGSCYLMGRLGIHRIKDEQIFEKTVLILEEIKENINEKKYLFNNEFTAADLTLTSLIQPLKFVTPLFIKYKSIFEYCDRIREQHDPRKYQETNVMRLFKLHRQQKQSKEISKKSNFNTLSSPSQFSSDDNQKEKVLLQYPSINIKEKAHNDVRVMKLNSIIRTSRFLIKHLYHLWFTIPKQVEYINNQGNKILQKPS